MVSVRRVERAGEDGGSQGVRVRPRDSGNRARVVRYRLVMDKGQEVRETLRKALRDCVMEACAITRERSAGQPAYMDERKIWERRDDGSFQARRVVVPDTAVLFMKYGPRFEELASYRRAMDAAQADPVVGPQLDALIGGMNLGAIRIDGDRVVRSLAGAMVGGAGEVEFNEALFDAKWREIERDLDAQEFVRLTVAPLPDLVAPFPVKLSERVELDRLTDEEVAICADLGFLGDMFPGMEWVQAREAVGLRCFGTVQKTVNESPGVQGFGEGRFGDRPAWAQHLLVGDVLSALRLVKEGRIRSAGQVSILKGWLLGGMRSFGPRGGTQFRFGQYELNEIETADLHGIWAHLSGGVLEERRFLAASLRRFNLALERDLVEDRIVDLMIAGESLFLHDVGRPQDRGEARFRLALRAAAFVESPRYTKAEVFRVMREGYDIRSQVVHGGTAGKCRLPDKHDANVSDLAGAVEGIMRVGLRKGLVTPQLTKEGFWESLLLPG